MQVAEAKARAGAFVKKRIKGESLDAKQREIAAHIVDYLKRSGSFHVGMAEDLAGVGLAIESEDLARITQMDPMLHGAIVHTTIESLLKLGGLSEAVGENSANFSASNRHMDGSGDWWVVDRDTGQRYADGLPTRESAEAWCIERNISCLTASEAWRVCSTDPVATAFAREHSELVFATRIPG